MGYDLPSLGAQELARQSALRIANELEDILAGLLINGVDPATIEVQHHPGLRIVVAVDGAPKYELTATVSEIPSSK